MEQMCNPIRLDLINFDICDLSAGYHSSTNGASIAGDYSSAIGVAIAEDYSSAIGVSITEDYSITSAFQYDSRDAVTCFSLHDR